jgi:hypothetical protein
MPHHRPRPRHSPYDPGEPDYRRSNPYDPANEPAGSSSDGYPRYQDDRYVRDPYEERTLRDLDRANDPYAHRSHRHHRRSSLDSHMDRQRDRESHRSRRSSPPPVLLVRAPTEDLRRRSITPMQRRGEYPSYRRDSETPPREPRASKRHLRSFSDEFGYLPPACR